MDFNAEALSGENEGMHRSTVIQAFLDLYSNPSYLEIGVNEGETFLQLTARRKIAVDPKFQFLAITTATATGSIQYNEMTSDQYFGRVVNRSDVFDVIYIDGLHTFEQTLRDLLNAVIHLKPNGTIIVDDVIPSSYNASLADLAEASAVREFLTIGSPELAKDGSWMGDVFKIPFFVDTFMQGFSYATVAENHGQMVMWRETRDSVTNRSVEAVTRLEFKDTILSRDAFRIQPLQNIVTRVTASIAS